ncbi:hypothetical protein GGH94_004262 [Coemansia aciculifera]|uniref:Uncharacterized protein n=1 Tax=Coemansia aciculifera TaxID=417176 RepID=A0A9W8IPL7_9FUNG|nr:hypothetical protein GGH94_004262 [Coemansia aciculifera]KAJ2872179.1 mau2 chromatid cohesion factor [Coemansia aciculifera]
MAATGEVTYRVFWSLAESHVRQAQSIYRNTLPSSAANGKEWKKHIISGLSCLYGLLRLCTTPRDQTKYFSTDLVLGADTESKTRLRIAQILGDWTDDREEEEERQLTRALMSVPSGDIYTDTRYMVVAAQCRLFMRREELVWAEQKLKSALNDAQQRGQHRWVQHFGLDLGRLYLDKGDEQSASNVLQTLVGYAQRVGDKLGLAVALVQQLGIAVHARNWSVVDPLLTSLDSLAGDPGVPQIWTRFWVLKAGAMHSRGRVAEAQEACNSARQVLMGWQGVFARQLAANCSSSSGLFGGIRGWSYYEAHAWVMLMSSYVQGQTFEPALRFLNLALEGVTRGEVDGSRELQPLKLHIFLRMADVSIAAQSMADAKHAIDQALALGAGGSFWRKSRDAIALRWAMYLHRTGHSLEAMDTYRCVIRGTHEDLRFAAQINLALLQLVGPTPECRQTLRSTVVGLIQALETSPNGPHEFVRRSLLELVQGIETEEPVKAKTHLLACLKICSDTADSVLQGWTLCLLGTLVLPAGQYEQAMRMCAAGQNIAQSANDPLQKAAAIGILSHVEHAVGDPERRAKLLEIDQQCLEQFNARIQEY